jgi:signal transduction histidine kinase/ActR/RegA family two-component response regulator
MQFAGGASKSAAAATAAESRETGAALLRCFFAHSREGLLLLDPVSGNILEANEIACRLLGYERAELSHLSADKLGDEGWRMALSRSMNGSEWHGPVSLRASSGEAVTCEASCATAGRAGAWLVFLHQPAVAAESRRIQQERSVLLEREKALRLEAEATTRSAQVADRMKDEFLATLSHELRTPLNAILGWAQTLQSGDAGADTLQRALSQIEQSAKAQSKLIDDLLYVSDIVAGRLRLEVQPMRLMSAVSAVIEALHPAMEAKGIRAETHVELDSDVILGDPVRVQQIVWNLLANAVKFTPRDGRIEIGLRRTGSQAELRITDSGDGISQDFLPYVFDRFRQADASSRKRHGGLGLGLSIARYLTEMHGGTIEASSPGEGLGATFVVRFPMRSAWEERVPRTPAADDARTASSVRQPGRSLSGLRVLTVDDDRNTREMLQEALRIAGADVDAAGSVREALEKLRRFRPDVLVSDIGMPEQDGFDLVRQLRALPPEKGGDIPAIALTGYARDEDRAATRRAGYQAVTPKPVNLGELVATIRALARQPVS